MVVLKVKFRSERRSENWNFGVRAPSSNLLNSRIARNELSKSSKNGKIC